MITRTDQREDWIKGRREKRNLARRARFRRQVLRYFLLLFLVAGGACLFARVDWCLGDAEGAIRVYGNQVVSAEQVRAALASCVGEPIYRLDPKNLERKVSALEPVRHAFVRRYLLPRPHLDVHVLEEFPWATLHAAPGEPPEYVIAQTGRLIPISEFPAVPQPAFTVFGSRDLKLTAAQVAQWDSWAGNISAQTGQPVEYVDLRKPHDVRVQDGDLHLKLGVPDSSLTRRIGRLASVVPALGEYRDRLEYIDLGLDNSIPLKVAKKPESAGEPLPRSSEAPVAE